MAAHITINKETQLCMSLSSRPGNFGTRFHNFLYQEMQLNFVYKSFAIEDIAGALSGMRALRIRGSAVSMPFKEACVPLLDEIDPAARTIGAVNTIVQTAGKLRGYNTDQIAVRTLLQTRTILPSLSFALLGSGGMAKAVANALHAEGFKNGTIVARNHQTGQALAQQYGYDWSAGLGDARPAILIHATPLGMGGVSDSQSPAVEAAAIAAAQWVIDVVAEPAETPLILAARKGGLSVITGAEIALLQAVEQFVLYTGVRPQAEQIQRAYNHAKG